MSIVLEEKVLDDETRPLIGKDAGPADDAHENAFLDQIDKRRDAAMAEYLKAVYAYRFHKRDEAEQRVNSALHSMMEAFWYAEDTPKESLQHATLHDIAKWKHDNLGCWLRKAKGGSETYFQECSIFITHKRMGFSVGSTGDSICTICNGDAFECEHSNDRSYWVVGGQNEGGECNACSTQGCMTHDADHIYRVCPGTRLKNQALHEVSIVRKPAIPVARIMSMPYSRKEVEENLGMFQPRGMGYVCHLCGGGCPGFIEMPSSEEIKLGV